MATIKVKDRQTLLDIQLIACGSLEGIIEACALNGMAITDDLEDGQMLEMGPIIAPRVEAAYRNRGNSPATGLGAEGVRKFGGIGYMRVGVDFIVS